MAGSKIARGPDTWELRVYAGTDPLTGRRHNVTRTFRGGKRDADKALAALATEVAQGRHRGTDATLANLLTRYLDHIADDKSPSTMVGYRRRVRTRIIPALGRVPLRKLRASDLDGYYRALARTRPPHTPSDIRQDHAIIRGALRQAQRWGWVAENVAVNASPPRPRKHDIVPPTPQVVRALIAAAEAGTGHPNSHPHPELGLFLRLAAVTGARRGELCAVTVGSVDLPGGALTIRRSVVEVGRELIVKDTKTHQGRRVSLDPETVDALAARLAALEQHARDVGARVGPDWFVFSHEPGGGPWRPEYVTQMFGRITRRLGATVRLHDLRHANASRLIGAGVDVRTVAGRLGHAQASTTLNIYSHFLEAPDRAAGELAARILDD